MTRTGPILCCAAFVSALLASLAPAAHAGVIGLDQHASGKTFNVPVGDRILLVLPANASTGYAWTVTAKGAPVLRFDSARYIAPRSTGLVGAPGLYEARFTVVAAGRAKVALVYARHTDPATPPASRFAVTIVATRS